MTHYFLIRLSFILTIANCFTLSGEPPTSIHTNAIASVTFLDFCGLYEKKFKASVCMEEVSPGGSTFLGYLRLPETILAETNISAICQCIRNMDQRISVIATQKCLFVSYKSGPVSNDFMENKAGPLQFDGELNGCMGLLGGKGRFTYSTVEFIGVNIGFNPKIRISSTNAISIREALIGLSISNNISWWVSRSDSPRYVRGFEVVSWIVKPSRR